ncbi:MAG TPA: EAL domain-containing protein [Mesorhizobium sp.]|jgi:diguanylate cyclase (GGDEF)-like protein/PAS domain S-box-containing protein|nr:EAL domain-containing protein [Mesorhizobium sp.]
MPDQNQARQSDELWRVALERAGLGVWDWDLRTGNCFYSPSWARMLGYKEGELPADSDLWVKLTHPEDRERAIESGDRHIAGLTERIETELRLRHKDGHWVWVLDRGGVIERDQDGKPLRVIGVQTDISRQKAAEQQIEEVNARFRLALAASGIGLWHHDVGSKISVWDAKTRELYGVGGNEESVPESLWASFLHPEDGDRAIQAHEAAASSGEVTSIRYRIVRRDGEVRHVETFAKLVADPQSQGRLVGTTRDVTDEQRRQEELLHAARHDALTGLLNRSAFDEVLKHGTENADCRPFAVLYVDLDYFKALNDSAGHAVGDAALKTVATGIRSCLPPSSFAARLGGDEFAILLPVGEALEDEASVVAEAILSSIRETDFGFGTRSQKLAASIGIALVNTAATSAADALGRADDACYAAKAAGRNRCSTFSSIVTVSTSGLTAARLAGEVTEAMENGCLLLFGQEIWPLCDQSKTPWGVEVLARLQSRDGQIIPPTAFIPAAERFGVAARLDRYIIRSALSAFGGSAAERRGTMLGLNLSAQSLSDPGLWDYVDNWIEASGVTPSCVVFEITESAAITNFDAAERFVRRAREGGCRVSLDDFGAGLSSFDYLRRFPIDSIKINGSFIQNMAASRFDREIVSAITGVAKSLGYATVAEKIESAEVLTILEDMGVTLGQGFFLHKPEPLEAVLCRIDKQKLASSAAA